MGLQIDQTAPAWYESFQAFWLLNTDSIFTSYTLLIYFNILHLIIAPQISFPTLLYARKHPSIPSSHLPAWICFFIYLATNYTRFSHLIEFLSPLSYHLLPKVSHLLTVDIEAPPPRLNTPGMFVRVSFEQ